MLCRNCKCKFCWHCRTDLLANGYINEYDHFKENQECWEYAFNGKIEEELKQETIDSQQFDEQQKKLIHSTAKDTTNCPRCLGIEIRGKDRINLIKCDKCSIYFCFTCAKDLGKIAQIDAATIKSHFEDSFCYYKQYKL